MITKDYKSKEYLFPSRNIDPKLKLQPEYGLKFVEAIYSAYIQNKCGFPYSLLSAYDEIRDYGNGKQSIMKYMEWLTGSDQINASETTTDFDGQWSNTKLKRKGYGNILWDIVGLAVRIRQAILGSFEEIDYEVIADTIDPQSTAETERKKSELFAEAQNIGFINQVKANAGIPTENPSKYPRDLDELTLMEEIGEFKTGIAKAIEKITKHSFEISNWYEIKRRLIEDIIDYNFAATRDYYDEAECKWKTKYIDAPRVIAQYSDERDFSDSYYIGYVDIVTIGSIRSKLEALGYEEKDIKSLAKSYSGKFGNASSNDWNDVNRQDNYGEWLYDYYKCEVLDVEWLDSDRVYQTVNTSKRGIRTIYDQEFGKVRNSNNNKTRITTMRRKYEAKWVIGTEVIYDHELSKYQVYNNGKTPYMTFHIYKGGEESITKRLIPVYDQFQMAWLKLQKYLSDSFDGITLLDMTMFDRIKIKGKAYEFLDLIPIMKKTGILPHRSLPINGKYPGGAVTPVTRIPSELMTNINNCIVLFQNSINMVEYITGINPLTMGGQPLKPTQVGTNEIAADASAKVLKPIIDSVFKIKKYSAIVLSEEARLTIRSNKKCYDAYARVIGQNDIEDLRQSEYELTELGISMVPRPTRQDIEQIVVAADKALEDGRNDRPGITLDIRIYITEKILCGANLKDIRLYLANAVKKSAEYIQMMKERNVQIQNQGLDKIEQTKAQAKQQEIAMQTKATIDIDNNKHINTMDEIQLKLTGDYQNLTHQHNLEQNAGQQGQTTEEPAITEQGL